MNRSLHLIPLALYLGLTSCRTTPSSSIEWAILEAPDGEVVFESEFIGGLAASPDGSVFVFAWEGMFRAPHADSMRWEKLSELASPNLARPIELPSSWVTDAYAPSRRELFVVSHVLYHWNTDSGWKRVATEDPTAIHAVWGRGADDVFAVGNHGTILHYDGTEWSEETNPLHDLIGTGYAPTRGAPSIRDVTGDETAVYAITWRDLIERRGGQWRILARPWEGAWEDCAFGSVVALPERLLVGGGERTCLGQKTGDQWTMLLNTKLWPGSAHLHRGSRQLDGSAMFRSNSTPFLLVTDRKITVYEAQGLGGLAGSILVDGYVYVGAKTQLVRFKLPS